MEIAVISDTHANSLQDLPDYLVTKLGEVDLIVHAGDFTEKTLLDELQALKEVKAVCGNMDSEEIRRRLSPKELFVVEGKSIGLTHGSGGRWGIMERVRGVFGNPDIIIYGHSHVPENKIFQGTLMFNPGTAVKSFGLLTIEEEIRAEIITI